MGDRVLTVHISEETLQRLRRKFAAESDAQAAEKALSACAEEEVLTPAAGLHGWDALDQLVGMVHGEPGPGASEHDTCGLGSQP